MLFSITPNAGVCVGQAFSLNEHIHFVILRFHLLSVKV
jgi:hypothetical protein